MATNDGPRFDEVLELNVCSGKDPQKIPWPSLGLAANDGAHSPSS